MAKIQAPVGVLFQGCYNPAFEEEIRKGKDKCFRFNRLNPNDREAQAEILAELLGSMGKETIITPPFWCDYGYNISVGDYFYANHNLVITDGRARHVRQQRVHRPQRLLHDGGAPARRGAAQARAGDRRAHHRGQRRMDRCGLRHPRRGDDRRRLRHRRWQRREKAHPRGRRRGRRALSGAPPDHGGG